MQSLKRRLLVSVVGSTVGILFAAAIALYVFARIHEVRQLDRAIVEKARLIASTIEFDGDMIELEFEEMDLREFETQEAGWFLEVWFDEESIYRSASLSDLEDLRPRASLDPLAVNWLEIGHGAWGRGVLLSFTGGQGFEEIAGSATETALVDLAGAQVTLFVGRDAKQVLATLRLLAMGLAVIGGAAALIIAGVLAHVVRRSMYPVDALVAKIDTIDASNLDFKLEVNTLPSELEPIVLQFNALMSRLRAAFERERGFCADVAHELRTPLTGLRTTLEITKTRERSSQEYARAVDQCHRMVIETQNLVEALLQIAKLESGQVTMKPRELDLNSEVQKLWQDVHKRATTVKKHQISWKLSADRAVWADVAVLEIVLRNLLVNALDYVNEDGLIEVASVSRPSATSVTISNSGSQVAPEDVDKVFHRFWRGSESRSDTGAHFGLGLSLAQRAAKNLGATLLVESQLNGVFAVTCSFANRSS